jgi:hypothetical protein
LLQFFLQNRNKKVFLVLHFFVLFLFFDIYFIYYLPSPMKLIIAKPAAVATNINTAAPERTTITRAACIATGAARVNVVITAAASVRLTEGTHLCLCLWRRCDRDRRSCRMSHWNSLNDLNRRAENLKSRNRILLLGIDALATALHWAEGVELYQVGSDNTLSTSDVSACDDLLRALWSIFFGHHLMTGLAAVEGEPALRRDPELTILTSVLVRF